MARRIVRHGVRQRAETRALEDALDPIVNEHADAKEQVWAAQDAFRAISAEVSDPDDERLVAAWERVQAAKAVKAAAAGRLDETQTWLRREAAIVKLQTAIIPELARKLALPILVRDGENNAVDDKELRAELEARLVAARQELATTIEEVRPTREALAALGATLPDNPAPPDLPPGSADVTAPTVNVRTTVNRRPNPRGGK